MLADGIWHNLSTMRLLKLDASALFLVAHFWTLFYWSPEKTRYGHHKFSFQFLVVQNSAVMKITNCISVTSNMVHGSRPKIWKLNVIYFVFLLFSDSWPTNQLVVEYGPPINIQGPTSCHMRNWEGPRTHIIRGGWPKEERGWIETTIVWKAVNSRTADERMDRSAQCQREMQAYSWRTQS